MKAFKLAVTALALSLTQFVAQAQAMSPVVQPEPVIRITNFAGLIMEGVIKQDITVLDNGLVEVSEVTRVVIDGNIVDSTKTYQSDWYWSPDVMTKILEATEKLSGGKVVDQNPKTPIIYDGPSSSYTVNKNGKMVEFAQTVGGHEFLPANRAEHRAARYLRSDLLNLSKSVNSK